MSVFMYQICASACMSKGIVLRIHTGTHIHIFVYVNINSIDMSVQILKFTADWDFRFGLHMRWYV